MALRRQALARFASTVARVSQAPPSLLRLGLPEGALRALQLEASRDGPQKALAKLRELEAVSADAAQEACVAHLQEVWSQARAFAAVHAEWRAAHAAWMSAFRARLRERRRLDAEEAAKKRAKAGRRAGSDEERPAVALRARILELAGTGRPPKPLASTQGCFVWGDVGRGKTLLLDIFSASFAEEPVGRTAIVRRHYHDFMRELHERLHRHRQRGGAREAIARAVPEMLAEGGGGGLVVLCLDEFQITNTADAVIIRSLFEELFRRDAIVVTTGNRAPEDLYKEGLNHMIYMPPFLALLRKSVSTYHLDAPTDYRTAKMEASSVSAEGAGRPDFMVAPAGRGELAEAFAEMAGCELDAASGEKLLVSWNRRIPCSAVHSGVALFTFNELCGAPVSADDYMALIQKNGVHTLAVDGVPRFSVDHHNEARRFTNLVDCLYENQCRLICTAAAAPEAIMEDMEVLSHVTLRPQPAMGLAGSEKSVVKKYRKHGNAIFEVTSRAPCRPDTSATAEADAEAGNDDEIFEAIRAAKHAAAVATGNREQPQGSVPPPAAVDDPTEQDAYAGVMSAAMVSLQESGFAARRCISRLREMGTPEYHAAHRAKWSA